MKTKKGLVVSLLCALLMGLSGCGSHQSSQPVQKKKTPTTSQSSGNSNASSTKNMSQKNGSGQSNNKPKSNKSKKQSNQQSGQSSGSSQNSSSNQNTGSKSNSGSRSNNGQPNTPPTTVKSALKDVSQSINTRVPLMLPTSVPIAKDKYLTATTHSETWYYNTHLYETNKPTNINTQAASSGTPIATVESTEYKSSTEALNHISGYIKVNTSNGQTVNLGNGITAVSEGAAGHAYLMWNEGRWSIKMNSPTDPRYKNKTYPDSKKLAENIVAYLHDHALPAPQKIGVVTINNWNNSTLTTVQWQYHEMIYQVSSHNPFTALKTAVAMRFNQ